jgi:hypothetical protein
VSDTLHVIRLRALLSAATPGPWKHTANEGCKTISGDKMGAYRQAQYRDIAFTCGLAVEVQDAANAALIVEAINALPDLLAALDESRAALADEQRRHGISVTNCQESSRLAQLDLYKRLDDARAALAAIDAPYHGGALRYIEALEASQRESVVREQEYAERAHEAESALMVLRKAAE